uniref:phosphodiester glycosidase family protein n=1 Tax=Ulvibacterium marinum TaxID=2419782 RepID=UPI002493D345
MKHRNTNVLGTWLALLLMLAIFGTANGQTGLDPEHLTEQWLAAYSTDFLYGATPVVYTSPYPNDEGIWEDLDMQIINFSDVFSFDELSPPGIKATFNGEDIPPNVRDEPAITVRVGLYDPNNKEKLASVVKFYTTYNATVEAGDDYVSLGDLVGKDAFNQYYTNNVKLAVINSSTKESLFGTFKKVDSYPSQEIVVEIEFLHPGKITMLKIPGIGEIAPQALLYAQSKNTFDLPTTETIVGFPQSRGISIDRWTWDSGNRLYGTTDNILNIAEIDFSQDSDLELKVDYVFKDPRSNPKKFNPKTFKNEDGSLGILTAKELASRPSVERVEPIMIDQPQSGMFDVVSNRAARAGALFAVNGAFYDYYYYCLPGVKTSLKIDGTWHYRPDIFNHRNTGALVFDDTSFDFIRNEKHDEYIGKENGETYDQAKNAYALKGAPWSNLMSGGHFSELGKPYRFHPPKVSESLDYFWEDPKAYYPNMPDTKAEDYKNWNKTEFSTWSMIACQKRDDRGKVAGDYQYTDKDGKAQVNLHSFSDAFAPAWLEGTRSSYGINGKTLYMDRSMASNIYTAVDYSRYPHEFGLQKRGRTFIAKKGNRFYIMTADGLYAQSCQYGGQTIAQFYSKTAPGLTIKELSDLSQKLEFDALLNLDGGGSSTFFVNGRGMVQSPYAGFAEGPMQQRYLSTTLMVVPKIQSKNIRPEKDENEHHLRFDNFNLDSNRYGYELNVISGCSTPNPDDVRPIVPYNDWPQVKALSLTPSLEKFTKVGDANEGGIIAGTFKVESSEPGASSEGAILFAMSENGQYDKLKDPKTGKDYDRSTRPDPDDPTRSIETVLSDTRSLFVVGIGKIPDELIEILKPLKETLPEANQDDWDSFLDKNDQASYVFLVNNKEVEFFQVDNTGEPGRWAKYLDGNWHNFNLYYDHEPLVPNREFEVVFDGNLVDVPYIHTKAKADRDSHFFNPDHITNAMIGAIPIKGGYVTPKQSDLSVDNYMFVIGKEASRSFFETLGTIQEKTSPYPYAETIQKMSQDIADHDHQLPPSYTGIDWDKLDNNRWYLQFEEGTGYHAHAVNDQKKAHFYGLNLWGSWVTESSAKKEIADTDK